MIYFFTNGSNIKIGYTKNIEKRLQQLNTGSDYRLYSLGYIDGGLEKEKELHKLFSKERIRINAEWFFPSKNLIDYINNNNKKDNIYVLLDEETNQVMSFKKISK